MQSSTYKYTIPHDTNVKFGIIKTLMRILSDVHLRNLDETIILYGKDYPWFNKRIKSLMQKGTLLLKVFRKNGNNAEVIDNTNDRLTLPITSSKHTRG